MLRDTLSQILGERMDAEMTQSIKKTVVSFPEVSGAYDLLLHNYGPDKYVGSIHIEIPDDMTIPALDKLERDIATKVYREHGVALEAVGIYSSNSSSSEVSKLRNEISRIVTAHEHIKQIHGFYLDEASSQVVFDMVVSFNASDREKLRDEVIQELKEQFPQYEFVIALDRDLSD